MKTLVDKGSFIWLAELPSVPASKKLLLNVEQEKRLSRKMTWCQTFFQRVKKYLSPVGIKRKANYRTSCFASWVLSALRAMEG